MKKKVIILVLIVFVALVFGLYFVSKNLADKKSDNIIINDKVEDTTVDEKNKEQEIHEKNSIDLSGFDIEDTSDIEEIEYTTNSDYYDSEEYLTIAEANRNEDAVTSDDDYQEEVYTPEEKKVIDDVLAGEFSD